MFQLLDTAEMKKYGLATDFIGGMREREESKVNPKLLMMGEGTSKSFDGISIEVSIEVRDLISREDLLKYKRSSFEGSSLKSIKSLQEIILPIQEKILEIEDNLYLGNEVRMYISA